MKKIIFLFTFLLFYPLFSYSSTVIIKAGIDIDAKILKGSITVFSEKENEVLISNGNGMQIYSDSQNVKKSNRGLTVSLNEKEPVILSYIKNIEDGYDVIQKDFVSIYSGIIPNFENVSRLELFINMPKNFIAAASQSCSYYYNEKADATEVAYIYNEIPDNIIFTASNKYIKKTITQNNVDISVMVFKEHEDIIYKLLQKSAYFIEMYERLFELPYPYKAFTVVEDINNYGHAVPSLAVFGSAIIDKDFVLNRSLGHEVLHQWIGCSVQSDFSDGNWVEALTTYFSDYYYEKDDRISYRKNILTEYEAYTGSMAYPLSEFKGNYSKRDQATGYGKGLMVLHMAKNIAGEDKFIQNIRKFIKKYTGKQTSWKELLYTIGVNEDFYNFWIKEKQNVSLSVKNIIKEGNKLSFVINRNGGGKEMIMPYTYIHNGEKESGTFKTMEGMNKVSYDLKNDNDTFIIDAQYDIMRYLMPYEITPHFYHIFSSDSLMFIGSKYDLHIYQKYFKGINDSVSIKKVRMHHFKDRNVIISAGDTLPPEIAGFIKLDFTFNIGKTTYSVIKNPYSDGNKFILIAFNHNEGSLRKLSHYGSYSYAEFDKDNIIKTEKRKSDNGIIIYEGNKK